VEVTDVMEVQELRVESYAVNMNDDVRGLLLLQL
jgi:hypothetical protein